MGLGLESIPFGLLSSAFRVPARTWMVQRRFLWQLFMPSTIDGVLGPLVSQYCQDVALGPYGLQNTSKMQQGAFLTFYAGLQDIKAVTLKFIVPADDSVLQYFYGWYHLMIDELGYHYPKSHYAKQIYVSLYDRSEIETVKFKLTGVFPRRKPSVELSYGSNAVLFVSVDLSVDNIEKESMSGAISKALGGVIGGVAGSLAVRGLGEASSRTISKLL